MYFLLRSNPYIHTRVNLKTTLLDVIGLGIEGKFTGQWLDSKNRKIGHPTYL